mmetsp:Transcript_709/g.2264  ORF Transcript_709/g.2264 Transcript_709/m.2264 type:complete len:268 (+) Transcript_709:292-1095(+)
MVRTKWCMPGPGSCPGPPPGLGASGMCPSPRRTAQISLGATSGQLCWTSTPPGWRATPRAVGAVAAAMLLVPGGRTWIIERQPLRPWRWPGQDCGGSDLGIRAWRKVFEAAAMISSPWAQESSVTTRLSSRLAAERGGEPRPPQRAGSCNVQRSRRSLALCKTAARGTRRPHRGAYSTAWTQSPASPWRSSMEPVMPFPRSSGPPWLERCPSSSRAPWTIGTSPPGPLATMGGGLDGEEGTAAVSLRHWSQTLGMSRWSGFLKGFAH